MIEIKIEDRQATASALGVELVRIVRVWCVGWFRTHTGRPSLRGRPIGDSVLSRNASPEEIASFLRTRAQFVADCRLQRARFDLANIERNALQGSAEWVECLPSARERVAFAERVMDEVHS